MKLIIFFLTVAIISCSRPVDVKTSSARDVCRNKIQRSSNGEKSSIEQFLSGNEGHWKLTRTEMYFELERDSYLSFLAYTADFKDGVADFKTLCGFRSDEKIQGHLLIPNFGISKYLWVDKKTGRMVQSSINARMGDESPEPEYVHKPLVPNSDKFKIHESFKPRFQLVAPHKMEVTYEIASKDRLNYLALVKDVFEDL